MKALAGNCYEVRERLKALGCKWDGQDWCAPEGVFGQCQQIVDEENRGRVWQVFLDYLGTLVWAEGSFTETVFLAALRAGSLGVEYREAWNEIATRVRAQKKVADGWFDRNIGRGYEQAARDRGAEVGGVGRPAGNPSHHVLPDAATDRSTADGVKPVYSPEVLTRVAGAVRVGLCWLSDRSPVEPSGVRAEDFLSALYEPGEKVLVVDQFKSQGQWVFEQQESGVSGQESDPSWPASFEEQMVGMGTALVSVNVKRHGWVPVSGDTYYCLRWVVKTLGFGEEVSGEQWQKMDALQNHVFALRKGTGGELAQSRVENPSHVLIKPSTFLLAALYEAEGKPIEQGGRAFDGRGPEGVWYLCNPIDGEWRWMEESGSEPHWSRRFWECLTSYRYMVIESDSADARTWVNTMVQLPLRIAAIYTSGGSDAARPAKQSVHVLIRLDARSKDEWEECKAGMKETLITLGADKQCMSAVRLTRLPGCQRLRDKKGVPFSKPREQKLLWLNPAPTMTPMESLPVLRDALGPWLRTGNGLLGTDPAEMDPDLLARCRERLGFFAPSDERAREMERALGKL